MQLYADRIDCNSFYGQIIIQYVQYFCIELNNLNSDKQ